MYINSKAYILRFQRLQNISTNKYTINIHFHYINNVFILSILIAQITCNDELIENKT